MSNNSSASMRPIKRTFALPVWQLDALKEMAQAAGTTQNAIVERALRAEWQRWRKEQRFASWQAAAKDPAFLRDIGLGA